MTQTLQPNYCSLVLQGGKKILFDKTNYDVYSSASKKTIRWKKIKLAKNLACGYKGYVYQVKGKYYACLFHRLVFKAFNPEWNLYDSSHQNIIDHIDNDKHNNNIENLRVLTHQQNLQNMKSKKGYFFNKRARKYQAQIRLPNEAKQKYLGLYETTEEAHQAYLDAKKLFHINDDFRNEIISTYSNNENC